MENLPIYIGRWLCKSCFPCNKWIETNDTTSQLTVTAPLCKSKGNHTSLRSSSNIDLLTETFELLNPFLDSVYRLHQWNIIVQIDIWKGIGTHCYCLCCGKNIRPIVKIIAGTCFLKLSNRCEQIEISVDFWEGCIESCLILWWTATSSMQPNNYWVVSEVSFI